MHANNVTCACTYRMRRQKKEERRAERTRTPIDMAAWHRAAALNAELDSSESDPAGDLNESDVSTEDDADARCLPSPMLGFLVTCMHGCFKQGCLQSSISSS